MAQALLIDKASRTPVNVDSALYINILPVSVDDPTARVWSHSRDRDIEGSLDGLPSRGSSFQFYRWRSRVYLWPLTPAGLPVGVDVAGWDQQTVSDVPARVVAFAIRDGALRHLIDLGFERLPGRLEAPAQLYRRTFNLAKSAYADLKDEVGMFPLVSIQEVVLEEDEDRPGRAGLIVDVRVINRLDLPLPQVAAVGMPVVGMKVRWKHSTSCNCGPEPRRGTAGKVITEKLPDTVNLGSGNGAVSANAECLVPVANRWLIQNYLHRVAKGGEADIERKLQAAISNFRSNDEQWKKLNAFGKNALDGLALFGSTVARFEPPMVIGAAAQDGIWSGPVRLLPAKEPKLNFRYGAPATAVAAAVGLRQYGPYDETSLRIDRIKAVVMAPESFVQEARRLARALETNIEHFPGFEERFHLRSFNAEVRTFPGTTALDYKVAATTIAAEKPDLAFLIVRNQDRYAPEGQDPYRAAKAVLVARDIPAQAVTREKLLVADSSLQWIISNIALAAYAKVGNVPYVLHDPSGTSELVLGVGRADIHDPQTNRQHQLFGAAVAFRQDGDFQFSGSTVPVADQESYEDVLSALISVVTERFEKTLGEPLKRITLHVFKRTGLHEVRAAERALRGRGVEFALVHVNRDSPLWLMEEKPNGGMTSAPPGTVVALGPHDRLLVTGEPGEKDTLHPLRLTLDRDSTFTDMDRIVDQAYGFTLTSWRTFRRTQEPSTILYGRLLAQKVGHMIPYGFDPALVAAGLGEKPWFV
ncbi:MAG: hypothetical protein M3256_08465 [Actinomycetota bacterium]|nr:hypothetical protein [Actinomycetota bacterium]